MTPPRDDAVTNIGCLLCAAPFTPTGRQQFCSHACRQAAYRRRHPPITTLPAIPAPRARRDITIYECPDCEQRYHAQQWCQDCNRPCRRIGPGGRCPHCDEPVTIQELAPKTTTNHRQHGTSA